LPTLPRWNGGTAFGDGASGEKDGVEYHFVARPQFQVMKDAGQFREWAEVHGEWYGTAR
jgi:guanylate kinase